MIVNLGLTETPGFAVGQNAQAQAQDAGNAALAQAVASAISSYGYNAWVEPSTEVWSWEGMVPPRTYTIRVEGLETYASVGGSDYLNRNAHDMALSIISNATASYPGGEYPSTSVGARQSSVKDALLAARATGTVTRPAVSSSALTTLLSARESGAASILTPAVATPAASTSGVELPAALQSLFPSGDVSGWVSENKWLLIGGAAVALFFMMGRGK